MHDGTENGVLGRLESKSESCWWLHVRGASEVFDFGPRDHVRPLTGHDFSVQSKGLFTTKHGHFIVSKSGCGGSP